MLHFFFLLCVVWCLRFVAVWCMVMVIALAIYSKIYSRALVCFISISLLFDIIPQFNWCDCVSVCKHISDLRTFILLFPHYGRSTLSFLDARHKNGIFVGFVFFYISIKLSTPRSMDRSRISRGGMIYILLFEQRSKSH